MLNNRPEFIPIDMAAVYATFAIILAVLVGAYSEGPSLTRPLVV